MASRTDTCDRYVTAISELWTGLARTLTRLDAIAAEPETLDDDEPVILLRRLQYGLHLACERIYGLDPPTAAEAAHADLARALAGARDGTAAVAEAAADGGFVAVEPLVPEWRGALFAVRLARMRLTRPPAPRPEPAPAEKPDIVRPLVALLLALGGALAFVLGAVDGFWPAWMAGIVAVATSLLAYRP